MKTDCNFSAKGWQPGEIVVPLGESNNELMYGDTFVNTSLQLRAMGLRFEHIPQFHCYTDDMPDYRKKTGIFDGTATHIHVGSLSSGFNGFLKDYENKTLGRRQIEPVGEVFHMKAEDEGQRLEYMRRIIFYNLAWEYYNNHTLSTDKLWNFSIEYLAAITKAMTHFKILEREVIERNKAYKTLWM